ncbi:MAG: tRNA preQ1(34) S-adenosylmethionine ribosyltransferase-isomerase QueA [Candidatus Kerfeldbacteria bacterium CG_4_10_14_0_8_um_filter_42_10]|uniref:S-adenosylmethionine:tRNA ribosyltransferase-isomerase n=1 Tax=Candidatus Kerfeldbacteria bacterium CG_4_10_14_0_8_um_filter_42_10 TaxID=2014248 RepID=A0A2M7RHD6_9BACT|nr:MAG: tRNA preQ1(34) S-adenosylmethionine ribosyltransferase-isomerase QueA [Candidatus Kerfeldbacteria bacterium CG_4_10_14_0_8_um_filter_42_10]
MKLKLFDFPLPKKHIAQKPVSPRDRSRLLVLDRKNGKIAHHQFHEIENFLNFGDVLVLNNSKVIPARLWGKKETGGKIEVFLLNKMSIQVWEVLIGGKGRKIGLKINFPHGLKGEIIKSKQNGIWQVRFNIGGKKFQSILNEVGEAPTPPYIKQKSNLEKYQTVYAKKEGSVAAPTAGFHFTSKLINRLKKKGIQFEFVTLHVSFGTFQPVKEENIEEHKMHPEFAEVKKEVLERLVKAKSEGRRIVAVGTTSVRVLESMARGFGQRAQSAKPRAQSFSGWINLFIYPGYKFKFVDALITNFHLPKSTLLMLVSAFASRKKIIKAYETAKKKKYRFYSFGDAMFIQ